MKTLIIYTNFGNGHKSAAYNISSQLDGDIFLHNTRRESSPKMTKLIEFIYEDIFLKRPNNKVLSSLYGFLYKLVNSSKILLDLFVVKTSNRRIKNLINKYEPDLIIFTFPQKIKTDIDVLVTLTDYSFDNCWFLGEDYYYTVSNEKTKEDLIKKGARKEKVFLAGIPIKKEYDIENTSKDINSILFNLGAKGYCNYKTLCNNIETLLDKGYLVEVMTGHNNDLFNDLNKKYGNKIVVYPFVNGVDKILAKNDIIVSKAGGLSITECIYCTKPVILNSTQSLSGQEEKMKIRRPCYIMLCYTLIKACNVLCLFIVYN